MTRRKGSDADLNPKLKALPGFPYLGVKDWMPTVMQHYGLTDSLKKEDSTYWRVHYIFKSARDWKNRKRRRQEQVAVHEPDHPEEQQPDVVVPQAGDQASLV